HVHISDCDGKVHGDLPPGRGVVKFAPYLQAIKELAIDGVVSVELEYSPEPDQIVEWVEDAYRESARLMDLVGLRCASSGYGAESGRSGGRRFNASYGTSRRR